MDNKICDRISYSEGVKINIGDYESRDIHISYSSDIQKDETFNKAFLRVSKKVKKCLEACEIKVRKSVNDNVDYDIDDKIKYYNGK